MDKHEYVRERRLLLMIFYEGPWERLSSFCYGLRRDPDTSLRWTIPAHPAGWRRVLAALGNYFERRDFNWRARHIVKGVMPHDRWKRRVSGETDSQARSS